MNLKIASLLFICVISSGSVMSQSKLNPARTVGSRNSLAEESAQTNGAVGNTERKITVTGYAEKEVTPDILYVSITLKEYFRDNAQKEKTSIEDLEKDFLRKVYDSGIKPAAISIEGFSGQINSAKRKKNDQFLASKRYLIKMSDLDRMNSLVGSLDSKAVSGVYVNRYEYSLQVETKKELRIKALQDAKQKASYMLASLDETLGEPISIEEIGGDEPVRPMFNTFQARSEESQTPEINFKKIMITATVKIEFRIK